MGGIAYHRQEDSTHSKERNTTKKGEKRSGYCGDVRIAYAGEEEKKKNKRTTRRRRISTQVKGKRTGEGPSGIIYLRKKKMRLRWEGKVNYPYCAPHKATRPTLPLLRGPLGEKKKGGGGLVEERKDASLS